MCRLFLKYISTINIVLRNTGNGFSSLMFFQCRMLISTIPTIFERKFFGHPGPSYTCPNFSHLWCCLVWDGVKRLKAVLNR